MRQEDKLKVRELMKLDPSITDHRQITEAYNVERVRSYLERNLGCRRVDIIKALSLNKRTVLKAIQIIRFKHAVSEDDKSRAVIAYVEQTGSVCYPSRYRNREGCLLCKKGPCKGPIEKFESLKKVK